MRVSGRQNAAAAVVLLAIGLAMPRQAAAQGWIQPRPGVAPADWGIEKLRTTVTVRVTDRVAEVEVEEWFRNNGGGLGEGDYVYPLPGEAVFSNYSLYQGDQELRGEMMDAGRAREIYEAIVRAKRDPALIELIGKGMMRARVFPIEPGQTRRITLRYTQVLDRAGDALRFRYAAGARHVGPAIMPMPRHEDVRERRIGRGSDERTPLTFTLTVAEGARYRDAFSPTHDVNVEREGGRMVVRPDGELSGDFAVFLPFAEREVGVSVATHRSASSEDGYFMITVSPGEAAESTVPRDVTVVVDVSGSMSGDKMEQARRALQQLLGTLHERDRVRLIAFSNTVRVWREEWTRATRTELAQARRWVEQLRAEGGTNINDALRAAFSETSPEDRLPMVIFLTDGLPTNGETRPERIVAMAEAERGRARVFAFGVGFDVNTYLLDRLSAAARGTTQYVRPDENVEEAVSLLATRVRHPVLTDLALDIDGIELDEIYPRDLPDLFAGEELVLFGRYDGSGGHAVTLRGQRNGRAETYRTRVDFPSRAQGDDYIARLWASRKLGDLDRRIRSAQADGAGREQVERMIEEVRETALRYGLLSEYTSYLVQEPGMVAADAAFPAFRAAPAPAAGEAAVGRAERARRSRDVASVAEMQAAQALASKSMPVPQAAGSAAGARVIAGRTFVQRDSIWQDTRHADERRVLEIAAYSDAYFALIAALPEVGLVLREVDVALIAGRAVSVKVTNSGTRTLDDAQLRRLVADFR